MNTTPIYHTQPDPDLGFVMPYPQPVPTFFSCPCVNCTTKEDIIAAKPV